MIAPERDVCLCLRAKDLGSEPPHTAIGWRRKFRGSLEAPRSARSTTSFARANRATNARSSSSSNGPSTTATSTRASTRAGTASRARSSSPRRRWWTACVPVHRTKPDWIREKNYFFKLKKYEDRLRVWLDTPGTVAPESRRNEILRLLDGGLEDISVSRAGQAWGIPLPFDPTSVVYVWFDALINYIAAAGYGTDDAMFARWWGQTSEPAPH